MQWVERFGQYLALALLAFMWPLVDAYQRSLLPAGSAATFALSAGAYAVIYSWYCLWGHKSRNKAVPMGTVLALAVLALALEHLVGRPDFNFFLIPLVVAGFALVPRVALIAIALVSAAAVLDAVLLDSRPAGRVALQLALLFPSLSLFGAGAMALRFLLNMLTELRAARAEIAQQAADREPFAHHLER
jgi:uncharacterized membrane protein